MKKNYSLLISRITNCGRIEFNAIQEERMHNYLVTGGSGFIGSHVVKALKIRGDNVTVIDNCPPRGYTVHSTETRFVHGSMLDTSIIESSINGIDCIIHLAAQPNISKCSEDPIGSHHCNVTGTIQVLETARKFQVPRIVYASSSSIYGHQQSRIVHETMTPAPLSIYGLQKLLGEQYCTLYANLFGLTIVSLRYFNVYGSSGDNQGTCESVIQKFYRQRMRSQPMTIYGNGLQTRSFIHVNDISSATLQASIADMPASCNTIVNIGTTEDTSVLEIAQLIGGEVVHEYPNPNALIEPTHQAANYDKATRLLSWEPSITIGDGVRLTYPDLKIQGKT